MSVQAIAEFIDYLSEHPELKRRLRATRGDNAAIASLAAQLGYRFTAQELAQVRAFIRGEAGPITEEELAAVAGGCFECFPKSWKSKGSAGNR